MKQRIITLVSFLVLACFATFVFVCVYWLTCPYKVMEICDVKMVDDVVKSGDYAKIIVKYKKYSPIPAKVKREIINDQVVVLPTPDSNIPSASKEWMISIKIPPGLHSGKDYKIHTTYSYEVNPLRTIHVSWTSPLFEIVNGDAVRSD